ncbi:CrcB protein [Arcanobacterium wilhelmae]|uniref:Fluoride-specific ion channel FluC n=1 Tax=Arcanobacterium wilhelmae TaxID=1803177 RepID=A0ABT9N932_9ACTO|nr:CrcB family protein [Arcanobacterium wilhelmae]MDP9800203.1 CrcB protein [Arcanobacterium wilhelmae]WFN89644.1 CrcB family protein [Arcanobacterium wilhelmae]
MIPLLLALAAAVGAASRFVIDDALSSPDSHLPRGTWTVNVVGSLALGLFAGAADVGALSASGLTILGTGFCGGFTTFSTASLDSVKLARRDLGWIAAVNSAGMIVVCVAAAALGFAIASRVC